jgi:DNA-directed RNA polymerase subunit RPC12/RpoP
MLANVTCPSCQHKHWIPEGEMGSKQTCPKCQASFFAGASVAEPRTGTASPSMQASYAKTMVTDPDAPPIKYNCPRCKSPLEAPALEGGTKKNCPNCTQRHLVPAASKPEPAPAAAGPALNKTMVASEDGAAPVRPPIKFKCPACGKPLEVPAEQGGTKRNCQYCNQRLQVPMPSPAAAAPNPNKTMLATEEGAARPGPVVGSYLTDAARGSAGAAAGAAAAENPWKQLLTPKNVLIGVLVLLLLLLVVPAVIRGGKGPVDPEAQAKHDLEVQKLKQEVELKKMELDRQAKDAADARKQIEEMMRSLREKEDRTRELERRKLAEIDDEGRKAALARQLEEQRKERERERLEMEQKNKQMLAEYEQRLKETQRNLEQSQQKQQTVIQQVPQPIVYPPYSPRYYWPWWW